MLARGVLENNWSIIVYPFLTNSLVPNKRLVNVPSNAIDIARGGPRDSICLLVNLGTLRKF